MRTGLISKALCSAALFFVMALPSAASTIESAVDSSNGAFSGIAPTGSVPTGPGDPSNPFSSDFDYFSFSTASFSTGLARFGATVTLASSSVKIVALQIVSFDGDVLEEATNEAVLDQTIPFGSSLTLAPMLLDGGDYYVGVFATGGNMTTADSYSGQLNVSQVPLPSSLALLGSTLLGCVTIVALRRGISGSKTQNGEGETCHLLPSTSIGRG